MADMPHESNLSDTPRNKSTLLWVMLLILALALIVLRIWRWPDDDREGWSGLLLPVGFIIIAVANLLDSKGGRLYRFGSAAGATLIALSLVATILLMIVNW